MAITGAERRALAGALLLALAACIRSEVQLPVAAPSAPGGAGVEPVLRIGLIVGAASVDLGGSAGVTVTGPDRAMVSRLAPGLVAKATPRPGKVLVAGAGPGIEGGGRHPGHPRRAGRVHPRQQPGIPW